VNTGEFYETLRSLLEGTVTYNVVCSYVFNRNGVQMNKEQRAWRLQLIRESHQRMLEKKTKELEEEETEIPDLFDEIEETFKGDRKNES